jgi:hypothetical protein
MVTSVRAFTICWLLSFFTHFCAAQDQSSLCTDGSGGFRAVFRTGVSVRVGASRNGELATRKCEAELSWNNGHLAVTTAASQVDLDAFGADLGLGVPVAAFQVQQVDSPCCAEYQVYSLSTPPRLLRTIRGGTVFSAADTDLDGRVEIWSDDASFVDGFEGLSLEEFDSAPSIILRFSRGKLLDVSAEFPGFYDDKVASLRAHLNPNDLRDFKDGTPPRNGPLSADRLHGLRVVKTRVLEIVWAYLYSGREQQAWRVLDELWPTQDVPRIRDAIRQARARGIRAQTNGISDSLSARRKKTTIFDAIGKSSDPNAEVTAPEPIMLTRPATEITGPQTTLILVVDAAGKVRSVENAGKSTEDSGLARAAKGWKFMPALKNGQPVASRSRISISPKQ